MKNKIIPIVSVVIGIIAFILTFQYLSGKQKELQKLKDEIAKGNRQVLVVAAKRDIPGGVAVALDDLTSLPLREALITDDVINDDKEAVEMLIGKKTLAEVPANKPILWSNVEGGSQVGQGLSPTIIHRMRAISLSIGGANAVSGMLQPGDRIDVLGTFTLPSKIPGEMETATLTMLQDVTVLATGQTLAKERSLGRKRTAAAGYSTVTLQVTPREAELLVFAQQLHGNLMLALRNPSDSSFESELPEVNYEKLKEELPALNKYRQEKILNKR